MQSPKRQMPRLSLAMAIQENAKETSCETLICSPPLKTNSQKCGFYFFRNKIWVFPAVKYCCLAFKMKSVVEALSYQRGDANPVVPESYVKFLTGVTILGSLRALYQKFTPGKTSRHSVPFFQDGKFKWMCLELRSCCLPFFKCELGSRTLRNVFVFLLFAVSVLHWSQILSN